MADTFNIDFDKRLERDFLNALERYADHRSNKSLHYILNRVGKDVAGRAAQFTHRAEKDALRRMLGQGASGGQRGFKTTTVAAKILARRIRRSGHRVPPKGVWEEVVRQFVGRTVASANFMRAGWLSAFKTLQAAARETKDLSPTVAFGRSNEDERGQYAKHHYPAIGRGVPARETAPDVIVAEIYNMAINHRNRTSWTKGLGYYGVIGLEQAVAFKTRDMLDWLNQDMEKRRKDSNL